MMTALFYARPCISAGTKGVAERGSRTKGWRERKARKKNSDPPILMVEVVADLPEATSHGSHRVQASGCFRVAVVTFLVVDDVAGEPLNLSS